jgi:hypothetical protein
MHHVTPAQLVYRVNGVLFVTNFPHKPISVWTSNSKFLPKLWQSLVVYTYMPKIDEPKAGTHSNRFIYSFAYFKSGQDFVYPSFINSSSLGDMGYL